MFGSRWARGVAGVAVLAALVGTTGRTSPSPVVATVATGTPAVATLAPGGTLKAGRPLASGQYTLGLSTAGSLTLRGNGRTLWTASTHLAPGGVLTLRSDGTLHLLDRSGRAVWRPRPAGTGARLELRPDGELVLRDRSGGTVWHTARAGADVLTSGAVLRPGEFVAARSGPTRLTMLADGSLVQTGPYGGELWRIRCTPGAVARVTDGGLTVAAGPSVCWRDPAGGAARITVTTGGIVTASSASRTRQLTPADRLTAYRTAHAAQVLFDRSNTDRVAAGLPALRWDATLAAGAAAHTAAMAAAGTVAEVVAGERPLAQRLAGQGPTAAENDGSHRDTSYTGALRLHRVMLAERGGSGRATLLSPDETRVGISVRVQDGTLWLTEDFAGTR